MFTTTTHVGGPSTYHTCMTTIPNVRTIGGGCRPGPILTHLGCGYITQHPPFCGGPGPVITVPATCVGPTGTHTCTATTTVQNDNRVGPTGWHTCTRTLATVCTQFGCPQPTTHTQLLGCTTVTTPPVQNAAKVGSKKILTKKN